MGPFWVSSPYLFMHTPRDKQRLSQKGVKEVRLSGEEKQKWLERFTKLLSFSEVGEPTLPILFWACYGPFSLFSSPSQFHGCNASTYSLSIYIWKKKKKNQPNNHNNNTIFPIISSLQSFSSGIGNIHEIFCIHLFCGIHMLFVHLDSPKWLVIV